LRYKTISAGQISNVLTGAHPEMSYFRTQDAENDYQK